MANQLKVLTSLLEGLGLIPSTNMVAYDLLKFQSYATGYPVLTFTCTEHMWFRHTYMQNGHPYKTKKKIN